MLACMNQNGKWHIFHTLSSSHSAQWPIEAQRKTFNPIRYYLIFNPLAKMWREKKTATDNTKLLLKKSTIQLDETQLK